MRKSLWWWQCSVGYISSLSPPTSWDFGSRLWSRKWHRTLNWFNPAPQRFCIYIGRGRLQPFCCVMNCVGHSVHKHHSLPRERGTEADHDIETWVRLEPGSACWPAECATTRPHRLAPASSFNAQLFFYTSLELAGQGNHHLHNWKVSIDTGVDLIPTTLKLLGPELVCCEEQQAEQHIERWHKVWMKLERKKDI